MGKYIIFHHKNFADAVFFGILNDKTCVYVKSISQFVGISLFSKWKLLCEVVNRADLTYFCVVLIDNRFIPA